jgi:hypothetical protein
VLMTVACSIAATGAAWGQQHDPALRERFVSRIMQAAKNCERLSFRAKYAYSARNVSVSPEMHELSRNRKIDPYQERAKDVECALRGALCLQRSRDKRGLEMLKARNDSYAFAISRSSSDQPPTLQFLEQLGAEPMIDSKVAAIEKEVRGIVLGAFYLWGEPLWQLVQGQDFMIQKVYGVQSDDGRQLVRVEFESEIKDQNAAVQVSTREAFLICDPDNAWAMTEYRGTQENHIRNKNSAVRHVRLEYDDPVLGIPVAKRAFETIDLINLPGNAIEIAYSVEVVSDKDVPEEEFYLSHYGLPEPNFSRSWASPWVWYLVGGIACLAIGAIILKRRKTRT